MQESLSNVSFSKTYHSGQGLETFLQTWMLEYSINRKEPYAILIIEATSGGSNDFRYHLTRSGCDQLETVLRTAKKWVASVKAENLRGVEKTLGVVEDHDAHFSADDDGTSWVWMGIKGDPKAIVTFPELAIDLILGMLERRHELEIRGKALALERQTAKQKADQILVK